MACTQDMRLAAVLLDDLGLEVVTRVEARLVPGDTLVSCYCWPRPGPARTGLHGACGMNVDRRASASVSAVPDAGGLIRCHMAASACTSAPVRKICCC